MHNFDNPLKLPSLKVPGQQIGMIAWNVRHILSLIKDRPQGMPLSKQVAKLPLEQVKPYTLYNLSKEKSSIHYSINSIQNEPLVFVGILLSHLDDSFEFEVGALFTVNLKQIKRTNYFNPDLQNYLNLIQKLKFPQAEILCRQAVGPRKSQRRTVIVTPFETEMTISELLKIGYLNKNTNTAADTLILEAKSPIMSIGLDRLGNIAFSTLKS